MSNEESPAARRHRLSYAIRQASSVDAGATLLEAFERDFVFPLDDLPTSPGVAPYVCRPGPMGSGGCPECNPNYGPDPVGPPGMPGPSGASHPADTLDEVDVPWELCELESLPDWTYATLLAYAVQRRGAPTYKAATMRAEDLLECRRFELIGVLALACEQAFELGDAKTCHAMARLCQSAVVQVIGAATMRVAFGAGEDKAGEG